MSQTAANRIPDLRTKDVDTTQVSDFNSATNSTKESPGVETDYITSPGDNQSTINTDGADEYTSEDLKQLEDIGQRLSNQAVSRVDFSTELRNAQEAMLKIQMGDLPLSIKTKMTESIMEVLKTKINCIRESNTLLKEKTSQLPEIRNQKPDQQGADEADALNKESTESSSPKANLTAAPIEKQVIENADVTYSKTIEETAKQILELEETIANLKQKRNELIGPLEDLQDDVADMQALIKAKKNDLDRKTRYIEELKLKISQNSIKKSVGKSGGSMTHRKTNSEMGPFTLRLGFNNNVGEAPVDISTSRVNTSVFQEMSSKIMSSKLGQVFGKVGKALGVKKENGVPEQILTTDFLRELDMQSAPQSLNNSRVQCNQNQSYTSSNFSKPHHGRNLSINNFVYK